MVSNHVANQFGPVITVIPTQTYSAERAYMTDLRQPRSTLGEDRVANASMIMTYDRARVTRRAGKLAPETLAAIDRARAVHLGLRLADLAD